MQFKPGDRVLVSFFECVCEGYIVRCTKPWANCYEVLVPYMNDNTYEVWAGELTLWNPK